MYYEIKTERLLLRPLSINDLNTVHEYASDIDNFRFMLRLPNETIEETAEFLTDVTKEWAKSPPEFYEFAIVLNGVQIVAVSIYLDDNKEEGELGWVLNKKYQKMGYAYEAARAVKDFALNNLRLKKLIAKCDYRNVSSYRLMERIGLKLESDNDTRFYPKRNEVQKELTYSLIVK